MRKTGLMMMMVTIGLLSGCNNQSAQAQNTASVQTQAAVQTEAVVQSSSAAVTEGAAQIGADMQTGAAAQSDTEATPETSAQPEAATSEVYVQMESASQTEAATQAVGNSESEKSNQQFTGLKIEVSEGKIDIRSGEEFSLTRHNGKSVDYEISDNVLHVRASRSDEVVLVLPESDSYGTMELLVKNGHAYVEDSVTVDSLILQVAQGEASLDGITVLSDSSLRVDGGSASLRGEVGTSVTAECRQGHLAMSVPAKETDYNYELELSGGNVSLGGHNYNGKSLSRTLDNKASRTMKLSCTHGNLSVQFH